MALDHSHTHSILINLFIKVRLNTFLLPPLLGITFVPSAFYAYVFPRENELFSLAFSILSPLD